MAGFPTPPPLKLKPTVSAIPESVRQKIDHPERITKLLVAFGVVGLFLFLIPCAVAVFFSYPWLRMHHVSIFFVIMFLAVMCWIGFSFGMTTGRRLIVEALHDHEHV